VSLLIGSSHLRRIVTGPAAAATFAEFNERLKNAEISRTHVFISIAVESMGAIGKNGLTFVKTLEASIMSLTKERRPFEFPLQRYHTSSCSFP